SGSDFIVRNNEGIGTPRAGGGFYDDGYGVPGTVLRSMSVRGTLYSKGIQVGAGSRIIYRLAQACTALDLQAGIDDATQGRGSVVFQVWADGEKLYDSGIQLGTSAPLSISVDVTARWNVELRVTSANDGPAADVADWGNPRVSCLP